MLFHKNTITRETLDFIIYLSQNSRRILSFLQNIVGYCGHLLFCFVFFFYCLESKGKQTSQPTDSLKEQRFGFMPNSVRILRSKTKFSYLQESKFGKDGCQIHILYHLIRDCYFSFLFKTQYILPYLITPHQHFTSNLKYGNQ